MGEEGINIKNQISKCKMTNQNLKWFLEKLKEIGNIFASSILTLKRKKYF